MIPWYLLRAAVRGLFPSREAELRDAYVAHAERHWDRGRPLS